MSIWLLLWACTSLSEKLGRCESAPCRQEALLAVWDGQPESVLEGLSVVTDPIERMALISALVEAEPEGARRLCGELERGPARRRCERLTTRPHLLQAPPPPSAAGVRAAGGPGPYPWGPGGSVAVPWTSIEPLSTACRTQVDRESCLAVVAVRAAREGNTRKAAAACNAVSEARWRQECFFQAAEAHARPPGTRGYPGGVELCLASGPFIPNCQLHLVHHYSRHVPPADVALPDAWVQANQVADTIRDTWADRDPAYGAVLREVFWSEATAVSHAEIPALSGQLLARLPPDALPHVRAAAARRLLELEPEASRSLTEWTAALETGLTVTLPGWPSFEPGTPHAAVADLWPSDDATSIVMPAVVYQGTSRRTLGLEPRADLAICLLEAAARLDPPLRTVLEEGLNQRDPRVSWTARRLLAAIDHSNP